MNNLGFINEQDIIILRNIVYKENNRIDTSIKGHPVLVIGITEYCFYYLTISSSTNINSLNNEHKYFKLIKNKSNRLKRNVSYVNLKNIYKAPIQSFKPLGHVSDEVFQKLILSLKYYQENFSADEKYLEIKDIIDSFIWKKNSEKPLVRSLKK